MKMQWVEKGIEEIGKIIAEGGRQVHTVHHGRGDYANVVTHDGKPRTIQYMRPVREEAK